MANARRGAVATEYAVQAAALQAAGGGDHALVAPLALVQREVGRLFTGTMWPDGARLLLPEADIVFFTRPNPEGTGYGIEFDFAWQLVREAAAAAMTAESGMTRCAGA